MQPPASYSCANTSMEFVVDDLEPERREQGDVVRRGDTEVGGDGLRHGLFLCLLPVVGGLRGQLL